MASPLKKTETPVRRHQLWRAILQLSQFLRVLFNGFRSRPFLWGLGRGCHRRLPCFSFSSVSLQSFATTCSLQPAAAGLKDIHQPPVLTRTTELSTGHRHQHGLLWEPRPGASTRALATAKTTNINPVFGDNMGHGHQHDLSTAGPGTQTCLSAAAKV